MKKVAILILLVSSVVLAFSAPELASAGFLSAPEFDSVIPCGRTSGTAEEMSPCTGCHFFMLIQRVVEFISYISLFFLVLGLIISGGMFVGSSVNAEFRGKAKSFLKTTVTGFILVALGYLFVNLVFWAVGRDEPDNRWGEFSCKVTP